MAFQKKNWQARLGAGLNKFIDTITGRTLQLESIPDNITQQGSPLSADTFNDLENRIGKGFSDLEDGTTPAGKANQLTTARTISLTGNASGYASFNGTGNIAISTTVSQAANATTANGFYFQNLGAAPRAYVLTWSGGTPGISNPVISTSLDNWMMKSGGTFTGVVNSQSANRNDICLRNSCVATSASWGARVDTDSLLFVRG